jgi:starvation-inducible DNA-binding protein
MEKVMERLNRIGLDSEKSIDLADKLNDLLANYQLFYMNVRGFHWNIRGEKFFELHLKFEELYNDLILKIDEIAERVLTLGATPVHSYSGYINMSEIKESTNIYDGNKCVESILDSLKTIIEKQRIILDLSDEIGDEGTNSMASDYIREQEKLVWMYSAFLNNQ